jgi:hypothetical protein
MFLIVKHEWGQIEVCPIEFLRLSLLTGVKLEGHPKQSLCAPGIGTIRKTLRRCSSAKE